MTSWRACSSVTPPRSIADLLMAVCSLNVPSNSTLIPLARAEELEDLLDREARRELHDERLARRGAEQRLRGGLPHALLHLLDLRLRPRGLDPVAQRLLEGGDLGGRTAVGRVEVGGAAVFGDRPLEVALRLEVVGLRQVIARGRQPGALERDLVLGRIRVGLDGLLVVANSRLPVADARGLVRQLEGLSGPAPRQGGDNQHQRCCFQEIGSQTRPPIQPGRGAPAGPPGARNPPATRSTPGGAVPARRRRRCRCSRRSP